jgi:cell division transport system permease protein
MIGRIKLLLSEAWRSTTSNVSTTLAATLTVLAALFVLGCAIGLITLLNSYGNHVKSEIKFNVYYCSDITCPAHGFASAKEIDHVRAWLEADPRVKTVEFIPRAVAFRKLLKQHPQYKNTIPSNPLPDAELVTPKRAEFTHQLVQAVNDAHFTGVQVAKKPGETKRILDFANLIKILSAIALAILGVASTLLVVNTIRLSIFSRRREIEVMKLVGASNWFVRGPFMIEGMITGLVGALVAIVLLLLGREFVLPSIHFLKTSDAHALAFPLNALILIAFGLLIGVGGSMITIRRFLRV